MYFISEAGSDIGSGFGSVFVIGIIVVVLAFFAAVAMFFGTLAYVILLITLLILCSAAFITGTVTAVINYRRAVISEIYCLKNAIFGITAYDNSSGYCVPRSSFRMLSDLHSIKRVFAASYRYQYYIVKRILSSIKARVLRYLLASVIQLFGYSAVTVLCLIHCMIFGISRLILLLRYNNSTVTNT